MGWNPWSTHSLWVPPDPQGVRNQRREAPPDEETAETPVDSEARRGEGGGDGGKGGSYVVNIWLILNMVNQPNHGDSSTKFIDSFPKMGVNMVDINC